MIGRDLRTIREACGVTMGDLASAAGLLVPFVSDVERGVRVISSAEVDLWIAALARIVRAHTPVAVIEAPGGEQ